MMLPLGKVVSLKTDVTVTVVGEVDIVDDNRRKKRLVGRLSSPKMIGKQLVVYILFSPNDVV